MWPFIDTRGGRAQAAITIQYVAGQPKYEVPFPAITSAAPLRGDQEYKYTISAEHPKFYESAQ